MQRQMLQGRLTKEEEEVINYKGTEPPFSGKYDDFWEKGVYICKRCNAALYRSEAKFNAGCGWPSFDEEILGAVKGLRTLTESALRYLVQAVAHIWVTSSSEKVSPERAFDIA